jgi:CheY-like chemotaxis protein
MTVAQWPDAGQFLGITGYTKPRIDEWGQETGELTGGFTYAGDRPRRWAPSADLWVHGYWAYDWANSYEHVRRLDPEARTPVVLLSVENREMPDDLPAHAEGWIAKSLNEDELLGELARVLCGPGEKARILVIEDDVDLAVAIGDVFSRDTIEVHLAYSLQEALDACLVFAPHLLVLDIGLPDGDGFNVVDWLRKHENLSSLPLVVYSGRDLSPDERSQLTLGPTHFLTKARVQPQQLEALVLTMLRSSRQMEEAPAAVSANS